MTYPLQRDARLITVTARMVGPTATALGVFGLDTGASKTMLGTSLAARLGLLGTAPLRRQTVVTVNSQVTVPVYQVDRCDSLGRTRAALDVLVAPLPAAAGIDGLLGLDFLGAGRLTLDFERSVIRLED